MAVHIMYGGHRGSSNPSNSTQAMFNSGVIRNLWIAICISLFPAAVVADWYAGRIFLNFVDGILMTAAGVTAAAAYNTCTTAAVTISVPGVNVGTSGACLIGSAAAVFMVAADAVVKEAVANYHKRSLDDINRVKALMDFHAPHSATRNVSSDNAVSYCARRLAGQNEFLYYNMEDYMSISKEADPSSRPLMRALTTRYQDQGLRLGFKHNSTNSHLTIRLTNFTMSVDGLGKRQDGTDYVDYVVDDGWADGETKWRADEENGTSGGDCYIEQEVYAMMANGLNAMGNFPSVVDYAPYKYCLAPAWNNGYDLAWHGEIYYNQDGGLDNQCNDWHQDADEIFNVEPGVYNGQCNN